MNGASMWTRGRTGRTGRIGRTGGMGRTGRMVPAPRVLRSLALLFATPGSTDYCAAFVPNQLATAASDICT
jgi:hypothetical protein